MKAVKLYKTLKNDIYNWGQIYSIVVHVYMIFSLMLILITLVQFVFLGTPLIVALSVVSRGTTGSLEY